MQTMSWEFITCWGPGWGLSVAGVGCRVSPRFRMFGGALILGLG